MSAAEFVLGGVLLSLATGIGGYVYGNQQGKAIEKGRHDAAAVEAFTEQINAHNDLVKRSNDASRRLRHAVSLRERVNKQSSEELSNELTATADSRTGCVFPSGVMRNLAEARDRAAQAAATGLGGTLPGTTASSAADR
jgi:uncharacterized protein HemX